MYTCKDVNIAIDFVAGKLKLMLADISMLGRREKFYKYLQRELRLER